MTDSGEVFWHSSFKEFFDTCQTCRDIASFFRDSTRMKRSHRELCTWFTDRLRGDDTDRCTDLSEGISCEIHTIAVLADTFVCLTGEDASDRDSLCFTCDNRFEERLVDHSPFVCDDILAIREIFGEDFAIDTLFKWRFKDDTTARALNIFKMESTAVFLSDEDVLCSIDETTSHITRLSCFESRISFTFTSRVCIDEVFED
jgi:hypothetical protein